MKQQIISVVMLMAVLAAVFQAYAAAPTSAVQHTPGEINYQGTLVKTDGSPVTDGTYTLAVRLYRVSSAGSAIWGGQYVTYTKGGYFNLMLGSAAGSAVSPTPTYAHNELWRALWPDPAIASAQKNTLFLGVTPVSGVAAQLVYGTELAPRQNLLAAPYAFRAQTAEYANQSIGNFKVNGTFEAGYDPLLSSVILRTYKSGSAPFIDIGVNGSGETKLQSTTTRVTSGQLIVSSPTQSFTAGAGHFTLNSTTGNINLSGKDATIDMSGNVNIKGAGTLGTVIGSTSKPLRLMGSSIDGRGPVRWNKPSADMIGESPFTVKQYSFTVPAGNNMETFTLDRKAGDYSAMVVAWGTSSVVTTQRIEPLFYDTVTGNWYLRIMRTPNTITAAYTVSILFVNKHMVDDQRPASVGP